MSGWTRDDALKGMRALLGLLEAHPVLPVPDCLIWPASVSVGDPADGPEVVRLAALATGAEVYDVGGSAVAFLEFGPVRYSVEFNGDPEARRRRAEFLREYGAV